jgi:hypothetical protein
MEAKLNEFLSNNIEEMLQIHETRSAKPDWTETYCDLQFLPMLLKNLANRQIFTPDSYLDYDYMQRCCRRIETTYNPDYLLAYYQVVQKKYQAFKELPKPGFLLRTLLPYMLFFAPTKSSNVQWRLLIPRNVRLAVDLYLYWVHLYGLGYVWAMSDSSLNCDHVLLQQAINELNEFVVHCDIPFPKDLSDMAEFLLNQYRARYPCSLVVPKSKNEIAWGRWDIYRLTHLVLVKNNYLRQPLEAQDSNLMEDMIAMYFKQQARLPVDASAEFFAIVRSSSNYAKPEGRPCLMEDTIHKLQEAEGQFLSGLHANMQRIKPSFARLYYHTFLTVPLYLSTVPRSLGLRYLSEERT